MLSAKELSNLVDLLGDSMRPLEQISSTLKRTLLSKSGNRPSIVATLDFLLSENLLIHIHQKLIAYYILYELHDGSAVPVSPILTRVIGAPNKESNSSYTERNFAAILLSGLPKEVCAHYNNTGL